MCPPVQVWNPAFDVTPSSMITGVITERGVIRQEQGRINVHAFMVAQGLLPAPENGHTGSRIVSPIPGFKVSRKWEACVLASAGVTFICSLISVCKNQRRSGLDMFLWGCIDLFRGYA